MQRIGKSWVGIKRILTDCILPCFGKQMSLLRLWSVSDEGQRCAVKCK